MFNKNFFPMPSNELRELVAAELWLLRANITQREALRLDPSCLQPTTTTDCIYGQLTGHYESDRALALKNICGLYTRDLAIVAGTAIDSSSEDIEQQRDHITRYTVLEHYITIAGAKTNVAVAYLRGELETVETNDL